MYNEIWEVKEREGHALGLFWCVVPRVVLRARYRFIVIVVGGGVGAAAVGPRSWDMPSYNGSD